jgi:hypothetical protein
MSPEQPDQDVLSEEANRLYWESEESVNQIGEELGLSKGVFYGLITPLPAGLPCPGCGEEMVFPNRTARDKGFLVCPECGMEEEAAVVQTYWEGASDGGVEEIEEGPGDLARRAGRAAHEAMDRGVDRVRGVSPQGRILAGTALLGVAAGIVLAGVLRRR